MGDRQGNVVLEGELNYESSLNTSLGSTAHAGPLWSRYDNYACYITIGGNHPLPLFDQLVITAHPLSDALRLVKIIFMCINVFLFLLQNVGFRLTSIFRVTEYVVLA